MSPRGLFLLIGLLGSTACSVIAVPPPPEAIDINKCESDDDCHPGGTCDGKACVVSSGTLTALIVEVFPPAGAQTSGGIPFYLHEDELAGDIAVDLPVHVTGKVSRPPESMTNGLPCMFQGRASDSIVREAADGTIPVDVSFTPSERVLGISVTPYSTSVPVDGWDAPNPGTASGHRFQAALPPGDYDIYIEPRKTVPGSCELVPVLLRNQHVAGDLDVTLPTASTLELVIRVPVLDPSLAGWKLDMLDPSSGRVLSTAVLLGEGVMNTEGDATEYHATLRFATVLTAGADGQSVADTSAKEVVRLSPPDPNAAPTLLYQRDALAPLSDPSAPSVIDLTLSEGNAARMMALPTLVNVQGWTKRSTDMSPVPATLTFVAHTIDDLDPQPASFVTSVESDEMGNFELHVPAGDYDVRAVPKTNLGLSATPTIKWKIARAPTNQFAKTILLDEATFIQGSAEASPSGWMFGASVRASASPLGIRQGVLDATLGAPAPIPLASADIVHGDGSFRLSAEAGLYDFYIQPEARSRYPWYVRASMSVDAAGRSLAVHVPFPVIHRGRVIVGEGPAVIPQALLRVYAYVTDKGKYSVVPTESVVQIAEARADENGAFELLIPATLDSDPEPPP